LKKKELEEFRTIAKDPDFGHNFTDFIEFIDNEISKGCKLSELEYSFSFEDRIFRVKNPKNNKRMSLGFY